MVGENLRNSLNELDRNIELVSLKEDVDIGVSFESLLEFNANKEKLDELFSELEFKPMAKNSSKQSPSVNKASNDLQEKSHADSNNNYETLFTKKDLKDWAKKLDKCKVFAIDTETDSLDTVTANLVGISLSAKEGSGCYIPIGHNYDGCPRQLTLEEVSHEIGKSIERNKEKASWGRIAKGPIVGKVAVPMVEERVKERAKLRSSLTKQSFVSRSRS